MNQGTRSDTRFTHWSDGSNDSHHYGHSGCWGSTIDETSGSLAIGYKAQGSFLVDFRQVDTTPPALGARSSSTGTVYPEFTSYMEQGFSNDWTYRCPGHYYNNWYHNGCGWHTSWGAYSTTRYAYGSLDDNTTGSIYYLGGGNNAIYSRGQARYNTVGSYTYNTGAHLQMVQNLSGDSFDAYYIKVKKQALQYLNKVTVNFDDGKSMVVDGEDIRQWYYNELNPATNPDGRTSVQLDNGVDSKTGSTKPTRLETDADGYYYFRLNLMKTDDDGNHVADFGVHDEHAYRDSFAEYDENTKIFRVKSIVYDVTINQGTVDRDGNPRVPDYGQWFAESLDSNSAEWTKAMSFEVTGRFTKTDGSTSATAENTVTSTTNINMTIGGDYAGENYVHKAAMRYDTPDSDGRGLWSYKNYHRTGACHWGSYHHYHYETFDEGKMRHLRTSSSINVYESRNYTQQSVVRDNGSLGWDGRTNVSANHTDQSSFAGDEGYYVSLYRMEPGSVNNNYADHDYKPWGAANVSATDNMKLTDTLPTIYPDQDIEYYGFLGTGLKFLRTSAANTANLESHMTSLTASNVWAHLNPETNYAYDKNGIKQTKNFKDVFVTLYTSKWNLDSSWTELKAATDNGWLKDPTGGRIIRIRENAMYLVEPMTLSADYNASTNLGQKYYKADGYQVLTAKAGDVVYQETMVDSNLNKVLAESASPGLSYLFTKGLNAQGDAVIYFKRPSDYTPDFMERANWASAPEYSYTKTGDVFTLTGMYADHNPLTINLPDGEFVTKYTLDLGPYGGDADATAETARIYDGDRGSGKQVSDVQVLGRPYIYKGQNNKLYNSSRADLAGQPERVYQDYINNALSTTTVQFKRFFAANTWLTSSDKATYYNNNYRIIDGRTKEFNYLNRYSGSGASYSWVPSMSATDTAWMVGYKVRYGYDTGIQTENNGTTTANTNGNVLSEPYDVVNYYDRNSFGYNGGYYTKPADGDNATTNENVTRYNDIKPVYDYGDGDTTDNLTPTRATYEVRFQNTKDLQEGVDNQKRAAHLSRVTLTSAFDENIANPASKAFRLQNVYVPAYLVTGGLEGQDGQEVCDDHVAGTCVDYQYTCYVMGTDGVYYPYDGARKLDGEGKYQLADDPAGAHPLGDGSNANGKPIYLSVTGDSFTKEAYDPSDTTGTPRAFFQAEACTGGDKHVRCVECDGGWFGATKFVFTYIDKNNQERTITTTWDELVAAGRVSGPWAIDPDTAKVIYDTDGLPIYANKITGKPVTRAENAAGYAANADGDYIIDVESFLRDCVPVTDADGNVTYVSSVAHDQLMGANGKPLADADGNVVAPEGISFPTFMSTDATNTNTIGGWANVMETDKEIAKALFTKVSITFEAPNAHRRFTNTLLDSGQWLTRKSEVEKGSTSTADASNLMINYAFKYDGTFVDRPVENFLSAKAATASLTGNSPLDPSYTIGAADEDKERTNPGNWDYDSTPTFADEDKERTNPGNWDYDSTPTFGKMSSAYTGTDARHKLTVTVKAKDPNTELLNGITDPVATYRLSHKIGTMEVGYVRGRDVEPSINYGTLTTTTGEGDGAVSTVSPAKKSSVFAYDAQDNTSMTNPFSYTLPNAVNDIPDGALYAGDYLEYTLYVGAKSDSLLPMQHFDARFTVQPGQRIVGWEVVTERDADGTVRELNTIGTSGAGAVGSGNFVTDEDGKVIPGRTNAEVTAMMFGDETTYTFSYDADGNPVLDEAGDQQQTGRFVTMANAPASTDLTRDLPGVTRTGYANLPVQQPEEGELDEADSYVSVPVTYQPNAEGEYVSENRTLVFSVGSRTQLSYPGEGVYIRVITQMTDELEAAENYNSTDNLAFNNDADRPSYSADTVKATFAATALPLHGYTQYRVERSDNNGEGVYKTLYDEGLDGIRFYHKNDIRANASNRAQYGAEIESTVKFYKNEGGTHAVLANRAADEVADDAAGAAAGSTMQLLHYPALRDVNDQLVAGFTNFGSDNQRTYPAYDAPLATNVGQRMTAVADNHAADVNIKADWVHDSTTRRKQADQDGNPMNVTVSNLANPTWHTNDVRVTVRFTKNFDAATQRPYGLQIFEMYGHDISYPADLPDNTTSGITPALGKRMVEAFGGTDPVTSADGRKLQETSAGRQNIKVEYYVALDTAADVAKAQQIFDALGADAVDFVYDKAATAAVADADGADGEGDGGEVVEPEPEPQIVGAWLSEDQDRDALTRFMAGRAHTVEGTANDYTDGSRGVYNINLYREAQAMRWTYFDIPATSDGYAAFTLPNVTLNGVGRFTDTRNLLSNWSDIANSVTGNLAVDVAYTHHHNEATKLDFNGTLYSEPADAIEHGEWRTKQNQWKTSNNMTVYRRSPNVQFQSQVFQTHEEATNAYNENATQKSGYVAGETFWYRDTLVNASLAATATAPKTQGYQWANSGNGTFTSTNHGHGSSSAMYTDFTVYADTTMTFQFRVSSESGYDRLYWRFRKRLRPPVLALRPRRRGGLHLGRLLRRVRLDHHDLHADPGQLPRALLVRQGRQRQPWRGPGPDPRHLRGRRRGLHRYLGRRGARRHRRGRQDPRHRRRGRRG